MIHYELNHAANADKSRRRHILDDTANKQHASFFQMWKNEKGTKDIFQHFNDCARSHWKGNICSLECKNSALAISHSVLKYKLHMREEWAVDFNEVNPTAREDLSDQATN